MLDFFFLMVYNSIVKMKKEGIQNEKKIYFKKRDCESAMCYPV